MSDFEAIDALLAAAPEPTALPPAERRRQLREELGLSRPQVASALGVSPSTLGGWESGREPSGELRTTYFLKQADAKVRARDPEPQASGAGERPAAASDDTGVEGGDEDQVLACRSPASCARSPRATRWPAARSTWTQPGAPRPPRAAPPGLARQTPVLRFQLKPTLPSPSFHQHASHDQGCCDKH
jgi:transcriptional regulator with XRE-family HTH domain